MQPIVNGLQTEYSDRMAFEQIDANSQEGQQRFQEYGFRGHPSYVITDVGGAVLWSATGQLPQALLQAQLQAALGK